MPRKKKRPSADKNPSSVAKPANLGFNQEFARQYEAQKRREILSSYPAADLERDGGDSQSSSSEEEDDFAELLTKKVDRRIRETLRALRDKDPRIYRKDVQFFDDGDSSRGASASASNSSEGSSDSDKDVDSDDEPVAGWDTVANAAQNSEQKLTLKDYVRENLLQNGNLSDCESDDENQDEEIAEDSDHADHDIGNAGENDKSGAGDVVDVNGRDTDGDTDGDTNNAEHGDDDGDGDDDDEFFKKRVKSKEELEEEEDNFRSFLNAQSAKGNSRPGEEILLHSYLENETPDEKERFLRDFVLNNGWLDKSNGPAPEANDYKIEIDGTDVNKEVSSQVRSASLSQEMTEQDTFGSDFDEKVDEFEQKYNFRFEEPGGAEVVSHARKIEGSLRRPDERRKLARKARRERKQHERLVKSEEIKHLKNIKKHEIEARLFALEEAAGAGADFKDFDLDADFDPEEFSRQMEKRFGEEYYKQKDVDMQALEAEDMPVATDALAKEKTSSCASGRTPVNGQSPTSASLRQRVDQLVEEYYNLNYEDIIQGTAVRFNYKKVEPESFGINADIILEEDDKQLNRRASLKYLAPYRPRSSIPARVRSRSKHENKRRSRQVDEESSANFNAQNNPKQSSEKRDGSKKNHSRHSNKGTRTRKRVKESASISDLDSSRKTAYGIS